MTKRELTLAQCIDAAIKRVTTGGAAMRIPADDTDPDVVLAKCGVEIATLRAEVERLKAANIRCHDLLELAYNYVDPDENLELSERMGEELDGACSCPSPTQWEQLEARLAAAERERDEAREIHANALIVSFVQGVAWWEWQRDGATLWPSDRNVAELTAERKLNEGKLGVPPADAAPPLSRHANQDQAEEAP